MEEPLAQQNAYAERSDGSMRDDPQPWSYFEGQALLHEPSGWVGTIIHSDGSG